jgi:hypothetical protein
MRPRRSEASTIWSTIYANRSNQDGYSSGSKRTLQGGGRAPLTFDGIKDIIKSGNRWRIVNGYLSKADMATIGPDSELGKKVLAMAEKLFTTDDSDNEAG